MDSWKARLASFFVKSDIWPGQSEQELLNASQPTSSPKCISWEYTIPCYWPFTPTWQKVCMVIGGICAAIAFGISCIHMVRHCMMNKNHQMRFCTLRILFIVPFYAADAALALFDPFSRYQIPSLLYVIREYYEAFVLLAFMVLVLKFLGGAEKVAREFVNIMQKPEHPFCFRVIPTFYGAGLRFVHTMIWGVLQFAIVMVIVTSINIIVWFACMHMDETTRKAIVLVPKGIKAVSCGVAMYSLTLLYFEFLRNPVLKTQFESLNPEMKFLCIKGIIMFTMLQNFCCDLLMHVGFFSVAGQELRKLITYLGHGATPDQVSEFFKNLLLCCEMLLFAILHWKAYKCQEFNGLSPEDFTHQSAVGTPCQYWLDLFRDMRKLSKKVQQQKEAISLISSGGPLSSADKQQVFDAFDMECDGNKVISAATFKYLLECAKIPAEGVSVPIDGPISWSSFVESFTPGPDLISLPQTM